MVRQQLQHLCETVAGADGIDHDHWKQQGSCNEQQALQGYPAALVIIRGHTSPCGHYIDAPTRPRNGAGDLT